MSRKIVVTLLFVGGLLLLSMSADAHHAVQAQFDFDRPVEMSGTLSKIEWINPHSYLHLDVKDDRGQVVTWSFETVGLGGLKRTGLRNSGVKLGDTYVFKGYMARNGRPNAFLQEVVFADSRRLVVWVGEPDLQ